MIAGESKIYDPVAKIYRQVDQIKEPFSLVIYIDELDRFCHDKARIINSKKARLYRVELSNGEYFLATEDQLVLSENDGSFSVKDLMGKTLIYVNPETYWNFDQETVNVIDVKFEREDICYDIKTQVYVLAGVVHN